MVKIINSFRGTSPIADTIKNFGQVMFGDRLSSEYKRQQALALDRQNTELANQATAMQAAPSMREFFADPANLARLPLTGYDPSNLAAAYRMREASQSGIRSPQFDEAYMGAGGAASGLPSTVDATLAENQRQADAKLAEDQRQFNMTPKPAMVGGAPGFVNQGEMAGVPGVAPILSDADTKGMLAGQNFGNLDTLNPAQQTYLGADPRVNKPVNYVSPDGAFAPVQTYDGKTDVFGKPLPPGGVIDTGTNTFGDKGLERSVASAAQSDIISNQKFRALVNLAMPLTSDPRLFGPQGYIRTKAQEVLQAANGLPQIEAAKAQLEKDYGEQAAALIPEFYDTNLNAVNSLWGLLVYQGAAALAGQQNRSVSDKDVLQMRDILGSPQSFFSSNISMRSNLQTALTVLDKYDEINKSALQSGGNNVPQVGGTGAAPAPTTPAPTQEEVWQRGPDGRPQRVQ